MLHVIYTVDYSDFWNGINRLVVMQTLCFYCEAVPDFLCNLGEFMALKC
jgi:hypothetical protein